MKKTLCRFVHGPKDGQWHMIDDFDLLAFRGISQTYFYGRTGNNEFRWMEGKHV